MVIKSQQRPTINIPRWWVDINVTQMEDIDQYNNGKACYKTTLSISSVVVTTFFSDLFDKVCKIIIQCTCPMSRYGYDREKMKFK